MTHQSRRVAEAVLCGQRAGTAGLAPGVHAQQVHVHLHLPAADRSGARFQPANTFTQPGSSVQRARCHPDWHAPTQPAP